MNKWTRRAFLTSGLLLGGGLVVGVAIRPGNRTGKLAPHITGDGETLVHTWVKLDRDNTVTVIVPHAEMGQGAGTALAQMLAEELEADWDLVRFQEAPALDEFANYPLGKGMLLAGVKLPDILVPTVDGVLLQAAQALDLQVTGGSLSVRTTGVYGMRVAGAAVKEMLQQAAADAWQVPVDQVSAKQSQLIHEGSGRTEPFSTFAEAAAKLTPPSSPKLKAAQEFEIMGRHVQRHDLPAKVDGSAEFALDVRLPDMLYATVKRSPSFSGGVRKLDDSKTRALKGVLDVVRLPAIESSNVVGKFKSAESVAVVADGYWIAKQGLEALDIVWNDSTDTVLSSEATFAQFDQAITDSVDREIDTEQGSIDLAMATANQQLEVDYRVPFLAHACMEPMNATARVTDSACEVWVGCQNPLGFRQAIAKALDLKADQVTVHNQLMGGGFGRKAIPDYAIQAAQLAKQVKRPVQLIWSREEDIRQDYYRPAVQSRFRAALDDNGNVTAWHNTYVDKHEPEEAPLIPYSIDAQNIGSVSSPTHVPFGAWRSVAHSQHGFFTESFFDEVAVAAGEDPYKYRAARLQNKPRHLAVLRKAAEAAGWGSQQPADRGRGISLQESFGSIVAQVVEVSIVDGKARVERVVAAVDAGFAVSPDGLTAQIESGIVFGLTAALYGEISIDEDGTVMQSNFHDYPMLRMSDAPVIETHIINSGHDLGGAGEPGTPGIAPALANAIYDATGVRIRSLPISRINLQTGDIAPAGTA